MPNTRDPSSVPESSSSASEGDRLTNRVTAELVPKSATKLPNSTTAATVE